jgi:hypothetical protein
LRLIKDRLQAGHDGVDLRRVMRARPDGLVVPEEFAAEKYPIDLVQVYATAPDVLGFEPGLPWLLGALAKTEMTDVLAFATRWIARSSVVGIDYADVDREFAAEHLRGDALDRAQRLLRDGKRLVLPQALLVMIKIAMFRSGKQPRESGAVDLLPAVMLAVASGLNDAGNPDVPARLIGEIVANQHFNNAVDHGTRLALFDARWYNPTYATTDEPAAVTYQGVTGVDLDDVLTVCFAVWAAATTGRGTRFERSLFDDVDIETDALDRVLALLSASPQRFRDELTRGEKSEPWNSVPWFFQPFERFPFLADDDGWWVISPEFLLNRVLAWPAVLDVEQTLKAADDTAAVSRFSNQIRGATENYVQDTLAATYGNQQGRVYTEGALREELGRKNKVADVAIDYGHAWVVAEISTRRLMRGAVEGGAAATLDSEVDALIKKAQQVDSTIKRIRETRFRSGPAGGADEAPRFYPALILTEGYPVNPIVLDRLHQVLRMKHLLTGHDTAPLELVRLTDLEAIEGLALDGGPTLLDVLATKAGGSMRTGDVIAHIRFVLREQPSRPPRVSDAVTRVFDRVLRRWQGGPILTEE